MVRSRRRKQGLKMAETGETTVLGSKCFSEQDCWNSSLFLSVLRFQKKKILGEIVNQVIACSVINIIYGLNGVD
jgi:hypothetical protein